MNHASLNTSAIFDRCMCCGSSIYGINVTRASTGIPRAEIDCLPSATVTGLNAYVFTAERRFWRFGVHLACFVGGLSVYWWGLRRSTWWRYSNRQV